MTGSEDDDPTRGEAASLADRMAAWTPPWARPASAEQAAAGPAASEPRPAASPADASTAGASTQDDAAQDGPAQDGPAQDGVAQDGVAQDGVAQDGVAREESVTDGPGAGDRPAGDPAPEESVADDPARSAPTADTAADEDAPIDAGAAADAGVKADAGLAADIGVAPDADRGVDAGLAVGAEVPGGIDDRAATDVPATTEGEGDAENVGHPTAGGATEEIDGHGVDAAPAAGPDAPGAQPEQPGAQPDEPGPLPELDDPETLRAALEAILVVVDEPVSEVVLAQVLERPTAVVASAVRELADSYTRQRRGFELRQAAGGWRIYTRDEFAPYVERFVLDGQQVRLTQAALETLAVVAYKQPVSRSRVSAIRGVNCDGVVRTLLTRGLIEDCGAEPDSGAHLYRTTTLFLERMGINSPDELPDLAPFLPDELPEEVS